MKHERRCNHCDKLYTAKRVTSKYCSDRCRVNNSRVGDAQDEYDRLFVQHLNKLRGMSTARLRAIYNQALINERNGISADTAALVRGIIEFIAAERYIDIEE